MPTKHLRFTYLQVIAHTEKMEKKKTKRKSTRMMHERPIVHTYILLDHKTICPGGKNRWAYSIHHVLGLNFLWAFKSTTITVMLSLLPF